jgi:hypothetical protein
VHHQQAAWAEEAGHHRKALGAVVVRQLKALVVEEEVSLAQESWASRCSPSLTLGEVAPWCRRG